MTLSSVCIRYQFMSTVRRLLLFLLTLLQRRQLILSKYSWSIRWSVWKWSEPSWDVGLFPLSLPPPRPALRTVLACSCPVPRSVSPMCLCSATPSSPFGTRKPFYDCQRWRTILYFSGSIVMLKFNFCLHGVLFFLIFELTDRVLLCVVFFFLLCVNAVRQMYIWF